MFGPAVDPVWGVELRRADHSGSDEPEVRKRTESFWVTAGLERDRLRKNYGGTVA